MSDPARRLTVSPGRVLACPRHDAEVELARCLECNWLLELDRVSATPSLLCAAISPIAGGGRMSAVREHID